MRNLRTLILTLIAVVSFSCHKENLPETIIEDSPIFSFSGNIDNSTISFSAGENDYYMFSSYLQDSDSIYNFIGNLTQSNCDVCANSISIQINDFKISSFGESSSIDSALYIGYYDYGPGSLDSISYIVNFQSTFNQIASTYLWDFGDGSISSEQNPSHTYFTKGEYNVCLTVSNNDIGCTSNICNLQKIGLPDTFCRTNISYSIGFLNNINFSQNTTGTPPFNYTWSFGDGSGSNEPNPIHIYTDSNNYSVELIAVDANLDSAIVKNNILVNDEGIICSANYSIESVTSSGNFLPLSKVYVTWIDSDGIIYRSNNILQPDESDFQILSINDYQNNENNQKTKKIHIAFNCVVYNGFDSIEINNAEAIIAVAYK